MSARKSVILGQSVRASFRRASKSARGTPKVALVILHGARPSGRGSSGSAMKRVCMDYCSLCIDLAVFGLLALIGTIYYGDCSFAIPLYLMITGYTNCVLSVFRFFVPLVGTILQCCFNFAMAIFGAFLVFANQNHRSADTQDKDHYCAETPFLVAFVFVIVQIIWFVSVVVIVFVLVVIGVTKGSTPPGQDGKVAREAHAGHVIFMSPQDVEEIMWNVKRVSQSLSRRSKNTDVERPKQRSVELDQPKHKPATTSPRSSHSSTGSRLTEDTVEDNRRQDRD